MKKFTISALALVMTLGLAGCSSDDDEMVDLDKAGDNISNMADDAGDAIEESYEDVTGQNDSAWEETKDAAGDAGEKVGEAAEEAGDAVEDAMDDATLSIGTDQKTGAIAPVFFVLHIRPDHALQKYPLQS
ncbi:YgdI/YgdR family lipoprotein [Marinobacter gelidimuriae]|uniref:YgdI/YgdR family lipoprotein n=1 Tax=Marinobacter gelidimuriae TaxID=2739064 RepID=UPI001E2E5BAC|nr:YgdI/YgdR family lipoprotein [Marinobacter gelidimuriae]